VIRLQDIITAWKRFFFEPESPLPIAIYRALLGCIVLLNQALLFPDVLTWFGDRGVIAFDTARRISGGTGLTLFWCLPHSDAAVWTVYWLSCLFALMLMLGFLTRLSATGVFLTLVTLHHRNPLVLNSGDTFLRIASFFIIFSNAGVVFSVDRLIACAQGRTQGAPPAVAPWAMRLIQVQLACVYLDAFLWKTMGSMWLDGTAVYYTSRLMEFWRFPVPYVFEHMWSIKLWTWGTLWIELALGTLVWVKEFKYWVLLLGLLLHLGVGYSMNIPLFGLIMVSAYATFVEPADLERWLAFPLTLHSR
jgi:hypothetical protein